MKDVCHTVPHSHGDSCIADNLLPRGAAANRGKLLWFYLFCGPQLQLRTPPGDLQSNFPKVLICRQGLINNLSKWPAYPAIIKPYLQLHQSTYIYFVSLPLFALAVVKAQSFR